ncbi:MAG: TfoX/Sxy family protein [Thermoplasmatota archaeon]
MAYDEKLAERIRALCPKAVEKKMFSGVGWMERGNLVIGIMGDKMGDGSSIIVRVPPETTDSVLREPGVGPMIQQGRPMKGWVLVNAKQVAKKPQLVAWLERSRKVVATLPPK